MDAQTVYLQAEK